jgi:exodeoxyribonuclease VII small subunit
MVSTPSTSLPFTQSLQALTAILERFRQQALPLEEALALFEEGLGHVKTCQATLQHSKGKLEVLSASLLPQEVNADEPALMVPPSVAVVKATRAEEESQQAGCLLVNMEGVEGLTVERLQQAVQQWRKTFNWRLQGKPLVYAHDAGQGLTALVGLANGFLVVSGNAAQLRVHLQLPPGEAPEEAAFQQACIEALLLE